MAEKVDNPQATLGGSPTVARSGLALRGRLAGPRPSWRPSAEQITGPVEQPHVRPWSTALRIPTDGGTAWLKATGLGHAYEGPLLLAFRDLGVRRVVLPLAVEPARGWILFDDAGPTLRAARPDGHGDHDLAAWERILPEYAELQRSVETPAAIASMLAAGTPDGRPDRLPPELERLLGDDRIWERVLADERADADRARAALAARLPEIGELAARVAASGVPPSIQHDDLHGGNIVVGPGWRPILRLG